jgi:hypothetical protein
VPAGVSWKSRSSTPFSTRIQPWEAACPIVLNSGTFVLPIHDYPARVVNGRVSRLVGDSMPGPEHPIEHRTCAETREMGLGREQFVLPAAP